MKKQLLGMAVGLALAPTFVSHANAAYTGYVQSDITGVQLWRENENLTADPWAGFNDLRFTGTAIDYDEDTYIDSADIQFSGQVRFVANGLLIRLDFDLDQGSYTPGSGIVFHGGSMGIDVQTTSGWAPYTVVGANQLNLGFLANQPGHMSTLYPAQTTAGIVRDALPGLWNGVPGSAGFDRGASAFVLMYQRVGLYLEGTISTQFILTPEPGQVSQLHFGPSEVPVPAAAWLFGSALTGLAGSTRLRRRRVA